jgi:hypothetical protein
MQTLITLMITTILDELFGHVKATIKEIVTNTTITFASLLAST